MRQPWDMRIETSQQQIIERYENELASLLGMIPTLAAKVEIVQRRGQFYLDMQSKLLSDKGAMIEWRMFLTLLRLSTPDPLKR